MFGLPRQFPRHGCGSRWAQPSAALPCALSHWEVLSLGWPLVWPGVKVRCWVQGQSDETAKIQSLRPNLGSFYQAGFFQPSELVLVTDEAFPSFHMRQVSCLCHRLLKALDRWHQRVTFVDITLGGINLSFLISLNLLLSHLNLAIIDLFCL